MKTRKLLTLSLVPESFTEVMQWASLLAPYCWADGEFGMVLTEAAFHQFVRESTVGDGVPDTIRVEALSIADALSRGGYADICLEYGGLASTIVAADNGRR